MNIKEAQPNPGVVLITGCSSGIGYHLAVRIRQDGYPVIASCRKHSDVSRLKQEGFDSCQLDLNSSQSIRAAIDLVQEKYDKRIYALINNGAYGQSGAVEDLSRDVLREQFETNVLGTQELTNLVLPMMRDMGEGRIIQISSILGLLCLRFRGAYNASKYALEALSDTMRLELRGSNIYVSLIEPGPITSDFRKNALKKFHNNIYAPESFHHEQYQIVEDHLTSENGVMFTLGPESVYKAVRHALTSKRPRIRYPVTIHTHVLGRLKRWIPSRWMDTLLANI